MKREMMRRYYRTKSPSSGRYTAAALGGMVLGIAASRLMPPVLGFLNGSLRARLGEDPFDRLERDHRLILATLDKMDQASEGSTAARASLLLVAKRALSKHATAEEDVVYPLLHDQPGMETASDQLYKQHAQMKIHLHHLEESINDVATWRRHVISLRNLVADHVRDEEQTEFPRLRQVMDQRRQRSLSGKIRREEAMIL